MCTSVSIKRNEARASHCVERDGFTRNGIALAGVDAHELCAPSGKKWIGMFIYPDGQWNVPEPHAFKALSLAGFRAPEDYQYYLTLVQHGEKVVFMPAALVRSEMPSTFAQMRTQDIRWEAS